MLDYYFSHAWEKLVNSGGTWADNRHCVSGRELRTHTGGGAGGGGGKGGGHGYGYRWSSSPLSSSDYSSSSDWS